MTRPVIAKAISRPALQLACLLLAACAHQSGLNTPETAPAASLPDPAVSRTSARLDREKAIAAYRDYLVRYPDSPEHDRVVRRLADLLVEQAADMQLVAAATTNGPAQQDKAARQYYAAAIDHYEYLLNKYPEGPDRTDLLYQLSRAYEESGKSQQALMVLDRLLLRVPDSGVQLYVDSRFRRGELLFAEGNYPEAGRSYQAIVDLGASVPVYKQALYKLGWSLFKQERYQDALPVLFSFLDLKLPLDTTFDEQLASLSPADREQVADVFRVISMCFAQLHGVDSVETYLQRNGSRSYAEHIYLDLAEFYIEQEQVTEAARTLLVLAEHDRFRPEAPRLAGRAIDLYRQAGFRQQLASTEAQFVNDYGMDSDFWTVHLPQDFPGVVQELQASLQDLARFEHAEASRTGDADAFRAAEKWYRAYLAAFGDTADAAVMNYQLAELLYEDASYRQAMDEYERTAWSRGEHPRAADAALGALRASEKILQQADAADRSAIMKRATDDALRFVTVYPEHPAAPGLLAKTGTVFLDQQAYESALHVGQRVLDGPVSTPPELRQVAWSIQAQAYYGLGQYPAAAAAYTEALRLAARDDPRRPALQEGLATATYKQAAQALKLGDNQGAVTLYQQAAQLAPASTIRPKAQFDAATAMLTQESWPEAIRMLEQFRSDYPDNPLQAEVTRKLAFAYERNGQNQKAAAEYLRLGRDRRQADALQRDALLHAAEIYAQTGESRQAVSTLEIYLQRFPRPVEIAVEVMQQLATLEAGAGNSAKRLHWLEEIVKLDRTAGTAMTRVPAAEAALELAENQLSAFHRIRLVKPVQDSLARKLQAMKSTLQAFEAAIDYGVLPVSTAGTYQIASMYEELGHELLTSERPADLSGEELAEYNLLLAEQAEPFEKLAIKIHTSNAERAGGDQPDPWVEKSIQRLGELQGYR